MQLACLAATTFLAFTGCPSRGRHTSDKDRAVAKEWIHAREVAHDVAVFKKKALKPPRDPQAETVAQLHQAMDKRLDVIMAALEEHKAASVEQDRKIAAILQALAHPSSPLPYQKTRRASKARLSKGKDAPSRATSAADLEPTLIDGSPAAADLSATLSDGQTISDGPTPDRRRTASSDSVGSMESVGSSNAAAPAGNMDC